MSEQNLITFIDHIGRTIIATVDSQDKTTLSVKNPAIVHVQPTQQGQLNVQTIPLYFREFLGEKSKNTGTIWKFNLANIVLGVDIHNDDRLVDQYNKLFAMPTGIIAPEGGDRVIKLFDE
jgi:hypothetical protein